MRITAQKSRSYGGKDYFKYLIVLPNKILDKLGWKAGDDLGTEIKGEKLLLTKEAKRTNGK